MAYYNNRFVLEVRTNAAWHDTPKNGKYFVHFQRYWYTRFLSYCRSDRIVNNRSRIVWDDSARRRPARAHETIELILLKLHHLSSIYYIYWRRLAVHVPRDGRQSLYDSAVYGDKVTFTYWMNACRTQGVRMDQPKGICHRLIDDCKTHFHVFFKVFRWILWFSFGVVATYPIILRGLTLSAKINLHFFAFTDDADDDDGPPLGFHFTISPFETCKTFCCTLILVGHQHQHPTMCRSGLVPNETQQVHVPWIHYIHRRNAYSTVIRSKFNKTLGNQSVYDLQEKKKWNKYALHCWRLLPWNGIFPVMQRIQ